MILIQELEKMHDYVNVNFEHGDNNIDEFIENYAGILENLNIPLKRKNIDKTKNKYGNILLIFCKANHLFIVNSRIGYDKLRYW